MKSYLHLILATLVFVSCGTAKKLPMEVVEPPSASEIAFQTAVNSGSVGALINCAKTYPEMSRNVAEHLLWEYGLGVIPYNELVSYCNKTEGDTLVNPIFVLYKDAAEERMIDEMSELDMVGVRNYYDNHPEASLFVADVINDAITAPLEEEEYLTVKYLHRAFENSLFSERIDSVYVPLRDSLLREVTSYVNSYEKDVKKLVRSIRTQVAYELDTLATNSTARVMKSCMDKKLPRIDSRAKDRIEKMYRTYVNDSRSHKVMDLNVMDSIHSLDESVMDLYGSVVAESDSLAVFTNERVSPQYPSYKVLMKEFLNFSDVQRDINWVSVGLTAASVAAAVATEGASLVVMALDGADLVYGIVGDNKKAKKVKATMEKLQEDMNSSMAGTNKAAVSFTFAQVDKYVSSTFANLKKRINEEF